MKVNALILAAGRSSRMGLEKALLPFDDTSNFLEKILNNYLEINVRQICVVVNRDNQEIISDLYIEKKQSVRLMINEKNPDERFVSVRTGLSSFTMNHPCFIHNIDNPYGEKNLLIDLMGHLKNLDWIKPVYKGKGGHPVLLNKGIISKLISEENEKYIFNDYLAAFNGGLLKVGDQKILVNLNTIKEFQDHFSDGKE